MAGKRVGKGEWRVCWSGSFVAQGRAPMCGPLVQKDVPVLAHLPPLPRGSKRGVWGERELDEYPVDQGIVVKFVDKFSEFRLADGLVEFVLRRRHTDSLAGTSLSFYV